MKRLVFITILVVLLSACSKDKQNAEMHQFVAEQEHDERLFGWWQSINSLSDFVYYDSVTYEQYNATKEASGTFRKWGQHWYWYTKDMWLYGIRDATPLTGLIDSRIEYRISDDNEFILTKVNGDFTQSYKKVHEELQIVD